MKKAIITFVKAPLPGTVKTRLQADMGAEKTLEIYKSFVSEVTSQCAGLRGMDKFLGCTPTKNNDFLMQIARKCNMKTFNQRGNDLGKKIVNAFRDHFKKGYTEIVLIGSDSPTIPKEYIRRAFHELKKNDFVFGPCCDGGLYLIGVKNKIEPAIFKNIPWDTAEVLNLTLQNLYNLNIRFSMLPFWYDVDNIDDLKFLRLHLRYLNKNLPV
ncbi:MAG TPA: glycosyltransferase [Nitrospirae bacterium]|nr:hypothetical protein BMS3Abin06_02839 [bacterium BMS3Abin06]HDH12896.1 glycosyltransferase [Nitrospirota bacterium]HDZ01692.1 glycosyltransferase [Nitrospirota bacterium]